MIDTETTGAAESHAEEGFDAGASIMHHILDSREIEIPFLPQTKIVLPEWHPFGVDLSITKHVVMMWIVGVILLAMFVLDPRSVMALIWRVRPV